MLLHLKQKENKLRIQFTQSFNKSGKNTRFIPQNRKMYDKQKIM